MDSPLNFDFNFGDSNSRALLAEAQGELVALDAELGDADAPQKALVATSLGLLEQMSGAVVELAADLDVLPMDEEHWAEHGLPVPTRLKTLYKDFRFYWVRFPLTLKPSEHRPFVKLQFAVEFNPTTQEDHLRPRTHTILPDRKFAQLLDVGGSLEVRLGENLEFEAAADLAQVELPPVLPGVGASAGGNLGVDAKLASSVGAVATFKYTFKKAQLNHTPAGTEKVFWTLADAEFLREDDPTFIVVLQVPREVEQVSINAALQAYPRFSLVADGLANLLRFLSDRIADFFRKGAPISDVKTYQYPPN